MVQLSTIQNFKNSKPLESSKKTIKFGPKNITQNKQAWEKPAKKKEIKNKNNKIINYLREVSLLFQHPLPSWNSKKNILKFLPSPSIGTQNSPPWTPPASRL